MQPLFLIIENDDGLAVVEHPPEATLEETASKHGGVVVDTELYKTYEDAYDAMMNLPATEEEEESE